MNIIRSIRKMDTKKKWLTVIRVFAALVIWFGIYKGLVYLGDTYLFGSMPQILRQLVCATVIPYALAMPLAYLVLRGMPASKSDTPLMKPSFANMGKIFLVQSGFSLLAQLPVAILVKVLNIKTPAITAEEILSQPLFYGFLLLFFAPVMEEFFFRKIFFDRLMVLGTKPAILLSALFFALPHIISQGPAQFFYTFVLGLSFGFVAARTKKIWPCMILHALSNLYCGILAAVWPKDKPVFLLAYAAIYIIAVPITAIVLLVTNRRKLRLSSC